MSGTDTAQFTFDPAGFLKTHEAMGFYRKYVLNPVREKEAIRQAYGFSGGALVSPGDWELFAAILIDQRRSLERYGHDLAEAEVKSAKDRGGFEYQYHLKTGLQKLENDVLVDHVFISYSGDYEAVTVRVIQGNQLRDRFEKWKPQYDKNYASRRSSPEATARESSSGEDGKQRFRRNLGFATVAERGEVILHIEGGDLAFASGKTLGEIFLSRRR